MRLKLRNFLLLASISLTSAVGVGYWYVCVAGAPPLDPPTTNAPGSKVTFRLESFNSKAMGTVREYGLILPPDYNQHPENHYPVIFLLHGGHDDAHAWIEKIGVIPVLDQLYKSGKLPPSIVITPDGNDKRGSSPFWDPQYFDGPNGKVGTLIGSELVQVVKSRYRALKEPQFWAMGGLSSGGWGAFNIGLRHLDNFNLFFSHIGYFTDASGSANSPQSFVQQLPVQQRRQIRAYMDAGKDDLMNKDFLNSTQKFHETLNKLGIENEFHAFPGGHGLSGPDMGWNYDHKHSADSLAYVGQHFKLALTEKQTQNKPKTIGNP